MNRTITYAVHDDGSVVSRVGSELAWPVLDYAHRYDLQKFPAVALAGREWQSLTWTKKVPVQTKNLHRAFWGMPPLPVTAGNSDQPPLEGRAA